MAKIIDFKAAREALDTPAPPSPRGGMYLRMLDEAWMLLQRASDEIRDCAYELAMTAEDGLPNRRMPRTSQTDDIAECEDEHALSLAEMSDELMVLSNAIYEAHEKLAQQSDG